MGTNVLDQTQTVNIPKRWPSSAKTKRECSRLAQRRRPISAHKKMLLQACLEESTNLSLQQKHHTPDYRQYNVQTARQHNVPSAMGTNVPHQTQTVKKPKRWPSADKTIRECSRLAQRRRPISAHKKMLLQDSLEESTNLSLQQKDHTPNYRQYTAFPRTD